MGLLRRLLLIIQISKRYKIRSEIFKREALINLFRDDTKKGEENLSKNYYEYLHDRGIKIFIEPKTYSGRIDMIFPSISELEIIADAKIFKNNKAYILKGINQLLVHLKEENQSRGFLLIYEICEESLVINFDRTNGLPFIDIDGKRIYFIIIDIFLYGTTSSKRGKPKLVELNKDDIIIN